MLITAAVQLTGEDHLVGFDRLCSDAVGEGLLPAPVPASTTAATSCDVLPCRSVVEGSDSPSRIMRADITSAIMNA